jgi:AbrB family looped-hinge helix DNA binding protein
MKFHTWWKEVKYLLASHMLKEECFLGTVTVGERGQIVIPAEARKKLNITTGDKLFIMSHPSGEGFVAFKMDAMREFIDHLAAGLGVEEAKQEEKSISSAAQGSDKEV